MFFFALRGPRPRRRRTPGPRSTSVNTSATCSGHLHRDRPVDGDHAAERRDRVALVRPAVRLGDVGADRDAARVGVLDDRHGRLGRSRTPPGGRRRCRRSCCRTSPCRAAARPAARPPGRSRWRRARPAGAGSRRSAAPPASSQVAPTHAGKPVPVGGVGEHVAHPATPRARRTSRCGRTPRRPAPALPSVKPPSATAREHVGVAARAR